ncbi:MAG: MBL fold metallo-hydrolase [Pseudomonadota bacterium]
MSAPVSSPASNGDDIAALKHGPDRCVLMGTKGGPAIRTGSPMPNSNLLVLDDTLIVVDCGLGVTRALTNARVALKDLKTIFITHLHSDHYLELGPLLHTAWTAGLKTQVDIWGPVGLEDYWQGFLQSMHADIALRIEDEGRPDLSALVKIHVLVAGQVPAFDNIEVRAMRVQHPPIVDCFALSFQTAKTHVVISADTAHFPPLVGFAQGADLLVHEAMLEKGLAPLLARVGNADDRLMRHWLQSHTLASDAAKIATEAGVAALALTHLLPADDPDFGENDWIEAVSPHFSGAFFVGTDGMEISLGGKIPAVSKG